MLSRAPALAVLTILAASLSVPANAENLLAGKSPSQIFSSTCSLCHKSARGMVKTVSPGQLPGFLRQHYTTSTEMAGLLSAYVLSNGATDTRLSGGDNLTKKGKERSDGKPRDDKPSQAPSDVAPEPREASRERKPRPGETEQATRTDPARPDTDGLQSVPGAPEAAQAGQDEPTPPEAAAAPQQKSAKQQKASKAKAAKGEPQKPVDTAKLDTPAARPDPVPQVTPAPTGPEALEALKPKTFEEPKQLTVDISPALQASAQKPAAPVASAGAPPSPPISH